jgi:hypothetical protein
MFLLIIDSETHGVDARLFTSLAELKAHLKVMFKLGPKGVTELLDKGRISTGGKRGDEHILRVKRYRVMVSG